MIIVDLPMPPSANRIWRSNRGRVHRSKEYSAWRDAAYWLIRRATNGAQMVGPVHVLIDISHKGRGDADNKIKPVLDALVHALAIGGDDKKHVWSVTAEWAAPEKQIEGVRVYVASASNPADQHRAVE